MTRPATKRTMKAIMPKISSHICLLLRSLYPRHSLYLYFFCSGHHTTGDARRPDVNANFILIGKLFQGWLTRIITQKPPVESLHLQLAAPGAPTPARLRLILPNRGGLALGSL